MLRRIVLGSFAFVGAMLASFAFASTQNVTPANVTWGFHNSGNAYPTAMAACQAAASAGGGHGATLNWSWSNFDGEMLSDCIWYKANVNGVDSGNDSGYVYPTATCPPGSGTLHPVNNSAAAMCSVSCADGDVYNSIAGACSSAITKSFYKPCDKCYGDPIYPVNGAKKQSIDLGISIGGMPISINYDSTPLVPQNDYNSPFEVPVPPSFGSLWRSSVHKSLVLQPSSTASGAQVGSQYSAVIMHRGGSTPETSSVAGSNDCSSAGTGGSNYVPTVNPTEKLLFTGVGSAATLIDQRALSEEVYDTTGAISSVARASGGTLTYVYTAGVLTSVSDQFGRSVQFGYEQPSDQTLPKRVNLITAPDGALINVGYTAANMVKTLTWADANFETLLYASPVSPQLLTGIIDEITATYSTTTYDGYGRAQSTYEGDGHNQYQVTYATPPSWQVTAIPLNASYVCRELRFVPPTGTIVYGPNNQQTALDATSVNGSAYVSVTHQPAGSGSPVSTSSQTYDSVGNVLSSDDFNGNRSCFAYDSSRSLRTVGLEGLAGAGSATPKACPTNLATYVPSTSDATHPERKTTTTWHPDWVLKAREAIPNKITTWVYNGQVDPIAGTTATCVTPATTLPDGKPLAVLCRRYEQATTDLTGASGLAATVTGPSRLWSFTYNQYGQVLTSTTPKQSPTDGLSHTTTYAYYTTTSFSGSVGHTIGDLYTVTNPLNQTTTFTSYDKAGRLLSMSDPNSTVTSMTYWPRGWLHTHTVTPAAGTPLLTTFDYWPTGLLKTSTSPDGSTLTYTYDTAHRLTDVTDALNNKVHYVLNEDGTRVVDQVSDSTGLMVGAIYRNFDMLGRLQNTSEAWK